MHDTIGKTATTFHLKFTAELFTAGSSRDSRPNYFHGFIAFSCSESTKEVDLGYTLTDG